MHVKTVVALQKLKKYCLLINCKSSFPEYSDIECNCYIKMKNIIEISQ